MGVQGWRVVVVCVPGHRQSAFGRAVVAVGHAAVFTGTRQARPTKIVTFPHQKAKKLPFQQHDLSILIVGADQLKDRLSRTRKPKSYPSSNTQCPITQ